MSDKHPREMTVAELFALPTVDAVDPAVALAFAANGELGDRRQRCGLGQGSGRPWDFYPRRAPNTPV